MKKIHWREAATLLQDSYGCGVRGSGAEQMDEFRRSSGVTGYWFCDFSRPRTEAQENNSIAWDNYNNCWAASWSAGPSVEEVDFSGIEEALVDEKRA